MMLPPKDEPRTVIKKVYLGDGVYADHDGYHLVLTTENGIQVTNVIYLEPDVYANLLLYVARLKAREQEQ